MSIWNRGKDNAALARLQDEADHAAAVREIECGKRRDGLWAKAIIESGGDETTAKIAYLRLMVVSIRDERYLAARLAEEQEILAIKASERASEVAATRAQSLAAEKARPSWFYYSEGRKCGPVSAAELRYHIKTESILPSEKVIGPGMTNWIMADEAMRILDGG